MPKYYCDYCDIFLTHDSPSVRKSHNDGWKHKAAVRAYYQQFEAEILAPGKFPGVPGGPAMPGLPPSMPPPGMFTGLPGLQPPSGLPMMPPPGYPMMPGPPQGFPPMPPGMPYMPPK